MRAQKKWDRFKKVILEISEPNYDELCNTTVLNEKNLNDMH